MFLMMAVIVMMVTTMMMTENGKDVRDDLVGLEMMITMLLFK